MTSLSFETALAELEASSETEVLARFDVKSAKRLAQKLSPAYQAALLDPAIARGLSRVVERLVDAGFQVHGRYRDRSPLELALKNNKPELFQLLWRNRAIDPPEDGDWRQTLLGVATSGEAIGALVADGADPLFWMTRPDTHPPPSAFAWGNGPLSLQQAYRQSRLRGQATALLVEQSALLRKAGLLTQTSAMSDDQQFEWFAARAPPLFSFTPSGKAFEGLSLALLEERRFSHHPWLLARTNCGQQRPTRDNGWYRALLESLSRLSSPTFTPTDIVEQWAGPLQPALLLTCGQEQHRLPVRIGTNRLMDGRILTAINKLISTSGCSFFVIQINDTPHAFVTFISMAGAAVLEAELGWRFVDAMTLESVVFGQELDPITDPLFRAVAVNDEDAVRRLLQEGADPNRSFPAPGHLLQQRSVTPVSYATLCRNLPMVELLLNSGADPNMESAALEVALNFAVQSPDLVAVLLAHGATADPAGVKPLEVALRDREPSVEVVKMLVRAGASLLDEAGKPLTLVHSLSEELRGVLRSATGAGKGERASNDPIRAIVKELISAGILSDLNPDSPRLVEIVHRRYAARWRDAFDPDEEDASLRLASLDEARISAKSWHDPENWPEPSLKVFQEALVAWSKISVGTFNPTGIRETWDDTSGAVTLGFNWNQTEHSVVRHLEDYMFDSSVLLELNIVVRSTGRQFRVVHDALRGLDLTTVLMTSLEEEAVLTRALGWQFWSDEELLAASLR